MIKIVPLDGMPVEYFESFDEFFKDVTATENSKLVNDTPEFSQMNWSFTIYPPKRVAALYAHTKAPCEAMQEAFEENFFLIEICTGDYNKPLYIVQTPNVDIDFLKRKWCIDYCTFHHLLVREI
jgi:hypothetical protein